MVYTLYPRDPNAPKQNHGGKLVFATDDIKEAIKVAEKENCTIEQWENGMAPKEIDNAL